MCVSIGLIFWFNTIFDRLDIVTARRVMNNPVRYYSDITFIKPGQMLSAAGLETRLLERGYKNQKEGALVEGRYQFTEAAAAAHPGQGIEVFFKPFLTPAGIATSGMYRFVFSGDALASIVRVPSNTAANEVLLEPMELGDTRRGEAGIRPWVWIEKVPACLKDAILDSEDKRFYHHRGIDLTGIARAVFVNVTKGDVRQGGSTITQQLVRNAFLTQKRTFRRKFTEAVMAVILELRYSKDRIFELYLNQIYLGKSGLHPVYGVEDAALSYFGRHVSALSPSECAVIAGLIPSPNRNNPRTNPQGALIRRNITINAMVKNKRLDAAQARVILLEPPVYAPVTNLGIGSYYIDYVRQLLEAECGARAMEVSGYNVYTALDPEVEKAAEKALSNQGYEGAIVAMDAYTGYVRALAGGKDFGKSPFNRAVLAKRSPGSVFKPLIFAAGLEQKIFKPGTMVKDEPFTVTIDGKKWQPRNYDGRYMGAITYRDALVFSRNIPAVRLLQKIGPAYITEFARKMGLSSEMKIVPSLALGTSEVTPLEMTASFAPFANGGNAVKPVFIRWVTDASNRVIQENKPELTPAISPKTASQITLMLEDAVNRGTGKNVRKLGYRGPAAGKTGTSDDFNDAWFIGYTPDILCGVWLGNDMPSSLGGVAAEVAVPVWTEFISSLPAPTKDATFGKKYPPGIKGFLLKLFGQ